MYRIQFGVILGVAAAAGCVGELEDEEAVRESNVSLRPYARTPNTPPLFAGTGEALEQSDDESEDGDGTGDAQPETDDDTPDDDGDSADEDSDDDSSAEDSDADDSDDAANELDIPASCGDVPRDIFASPTKCGTAICHGSADEPIDGSLGVVSDLGYSVDDVFDRMLDFEVEDGACAGELIIDGDNPEDSLLLTKLTEGSCGNIMPFPLPGFEISEEEIDCIEAWVFALVEASN